MGVFGNTINKLICSTQKNSHFLSLHLKKTLTGFHSNLNGKLGQKTVSAFPVGILDEKIWLARFAINSWNPRERNKNRIKDLFYAGRTVPRVRKREKNPFWLMLWQKTVNKGFNVTSWDIKWVNTIVTS